MDAWVHGRCVSCRGSKEFLLTPMVILRNPQEGVKIEATVNSVRVSVKVDTHDSLEVMLLQKLHKFLVTRAERFLILRRKPIPVSLGHCTTLVCAWQHCVHLATSCALGNFACTWQRCVLLATSRALGNVACPWQRRVHLAA